MRSRTSVFPETVCVRGNAASGRASLCTWMVVVRMEYAERSPAVTCTRVDLPLIVN